MLSQRLKELAAAGVVHADAKEKRLDETGSAAPAPRSGKSRSPQEAHAPWLLAVIEAEPDLSLEELALRIEGELGMKTSTSAVDRFVQRHDLSFS